MTAGRFVAVVGPSGAGKDSIIAALTASRPDLHRVRRVITRPTGASGEDFDRVSPAQFEARRDAGGFALWWAAHGLLYGIPVKVQDRLADGTDVLANLSRAQLLAASEVFPTLHILHITAPPDVLARRLALRGRETADDIRARLAREVALPEGLPVICVDDGGRLADSVAAALAALYPDRA